MNSASHKCHTFPAMSHHQTLQHLHQATQHNDWPIFLLIICWLHILLSFNKAFPLACPTYFFSIHCWPTLYLTNMMDQLHQWTRKGLQMSNNWTSIRPLTGPHNILLSQLERAGFDGWVDGVVDEELIRHQEDSGQWLGVLKDIRDKRCPSGICIGTGVFNIFINDINKEIKCALSKFT